MACNKGGGWDIILAANDFSVLAGVLAGFVITAAAILFASSGRNAPFTLALFAASVPVVAASSYVFGAISGVEREDEPDKTLTAIADRLGARRAAPAPNSISDQCAQVWSQGIVATAMLTVGGAVLICGLGWVLVTYAEEFRITLYSKQVEYMEMADKLGKLFPENPRKLEELKLSKAMTDPATAEHTIVNRRGQLVFLNGLLISVATTMSAAIIVGANMVYIKSGYFESISSTAGIFLVVALGLYAMAQSLYTVIRRTVNARRQIKPPNAEFDAQRQFPTHRRALNISLTFAVLLLATWLSGFWKKYDDCKAGGCWEGPVIVILVLLALTIFIFGVGELWWNRSWKSARVEVLSTKAALSDESDKFDVGRLPETAGHVALFALTATLFAVLETQTPLWSGVRIPLTVFFGLVYPLVLIVGLARSAAAAKENYCVPPWIIIGEDENGEPLAANWWKRNLIGRLP